MLIPPRPFPLPVAGEHPPGPQAPSLPLAAVATPHAPHTATQRHLNSSHSFACLFPSGGRTEISLLCWVKPPARSVLSHSVTHQLGGLPSFHSAQAANALTDNSIPTTVIVLPLPACQENRVCSVSTTGPDHQAGSSSPGSPLLSRAGWKRLRWYRRRAPSSPGEPPGHHPSGPLAAAGSSQPHELARPRAGRSPYSRKALPQHTTSLCLRLNFTLRSRPLHADPSAPALPHPAERTKMKLYKISPAP